MAHIETIGGKVVLARRGHEVHCSVSKTETWLPVERKSKRGVTHTKYKRSLLNK